MNLVEVKGVWLSKTKTAYILDRIEYISSVNVKAVMYMFLREMPMSTVSARFPSSQCSEILIMENTNF